MNKSHITYIIAAPIIIFLVFIGIFSLTSAKNDAGSSEELLALATCISDAGAKFYGAFWCPHCQDQKKDFGDASDALPYVECSTPDGRGQTEVCAQAKIEGYPTWVFANGERLSGHIAIASLAEATGCPAPQKKP